MHNAMALALHGSCANYNNALNHSLIFSTILIKYQSITPKIIITVPETNELKVTQSKMWWEHLIREIWNYVGVFIMKQKVGVPYLSPFLAKLQKHICISQSQKLLFLFSILWATPQTEFLGCYFPNIMLPFWFVAFQLLKRLINLLSKTHFLSIDLSVQVSNWSYHMLLSSTSTLVSISINA